MWQPPTMLLGCVPPLLVCDWLTGFVVNLHTLCQLERVNRLLSAPEILSGQGHVTNITPQRSGVIEVRCGRGQM